MAGSARSLSLQGFHPIQWLFLDGYLWDWIAAAALIVINQVVPFSSRVEPRDRYTTPGDPTLSYPDAGSTISGVVLYVLTFLFPLAVFLVFLLLQRSFVDLHHAILTLAEGYGLASGWKRWMNLVGRQRPHWFASVASGNASNIEDARASYPSGHSAFMFFGMTILSLYLLGKLHVFTHSTNGHFPKALFCIAPMVLATYVAVTRIADYQHNPSDVNAGCFIGMVCGAFSYLLNFHSPFSVLSGQPRLRSTAIERQLPQKEKDIGSGYGGQAVNYGPPDRDQGGLGYGGPGLGYGTHDAGTVMQPQMGTGAAVARASSLRSSLPV